MIDTDLMKGNIFCLANVDAKKVLESLDDDEDNNGINESRKRKRLDDFTPQEKMVRRKLKNRVAAQNARDRKKERLEHLETIVNRLEKENKELKQSNEELRMNMNTLMEENKKMRIKFGMDVEQPKEQETPIIITPTVIDHDHIVIKKEEETEPEYAAESSVTSCFFNHDVVSKSQTGQLLILLEQLRAGSLGEVTYSEEVEIQEKAQYVQIGADRKNNENELNSDNSDMSTEETEELFSLCKDIQELVDGPDNTLKTIGSIDNLIHELPDEVTKCTDFDIEQFLDDDSFCSSNVSTSEDSDTDLSSLLEDEISNSKNISSLDDDFLELFPSLTSV